MDDEDVIRHEFINGPLTWLGAIRRLEGLGYNEIDAEGLLVDWSVDEILAEDAP